MRVERVGVNVGVANGAGGVLGYNLGVRTTLNILEENSGFFLDNYLQPFREERFQLAHVLEGEVERLKAGDGRLGEVVAVELAKGKANISLGVAELDPLLLEHLGKLLQLICENLYHLVSFVLSNNLDKIPLSVNLR